ncbi:MAG: pyridoxamine 5'-phosphate oxidase [Burkholderiales bacterium]|nr:pyridoxamine 5'-phosphate oxidase [Burkholderiales bacterium]
MNESLFEPVPDFDQPIAVLKHCHNRIRKQIATMQRLLEHLPSAGADEQAQQAAKAVLKYFNQAALLHHADEEENLMPMLSATAQGEDAELLTQLLPKILKEHKMMEATWQVLALQLSDIATGESDALSEHDVQNFSDLYAGHMVKEETHIAPMAMRIFSAEQMASLGEAMKARRGLSQAMPATVPLPDIAAMRTDYAQKTLSEHDVLDQPIDQFGVWFAEAIAASVAEANAMSVATVDAQGRPSNRILLLKNVDARGFTWFTNYDSRKGQDLAANPHAALLFFWNELERQVRIEGTVERISAEESDAYFHSRPLASRLGAVASAQSQPIVDRASMEQQYAAAQAKFGDAPVRPAEWGGYRLSPTRIEFWQGRQSRFHDRIVYILQADGSWSKQRLQP